MRKRALAGAWAACACLALTATPTRAATGDVVLYAADAVRMTGHWTRVADATGAGGQILSSADAGWSSTSAPAASPAHLVEFTFDAPANTPHHVWLRLRAAGNNRANDSVYAQFSDSLASGTPAYRIGTTNGLTLNLQTGDRAKLNGWGWTDGAYWLAQASTITFANSGPHTLRIQTREDGVQLDQVVLSPTAYLSAAPGLRSGDKTIIAKPTTTPAAPTPFTGTARALPGTVEAEDFDNGGEALAYHDADAVNSGGAYRQTGVDLEAASEGGFDVGWISPGEWLAYSVNVGAAGQYRLEARVAAQGQGGTFHVEFGGTDVTGPLTIPNTGGWQAWTTVSAVVALKAGPQVARVVFDAASAGIVGNLNWMRLAASAPGPYTGTAFPLPGSIRVEQFDNGGQGVAYSDTTPGNTGGAARATDVDLEASSLGGTNIGWIAAGEWVTYSVNVAAAGDYSLRVAVAAPGTGGQLRAAVGATSLSAIPVPATGSWQTWQEVGWTATLAGGAQTLTLFFDQGGFNVGAITVAAVTPGDPVTPPPPPPVTGPQITVTQGDNLQAAIDAAKPGDTILLQAGATFVGNFTLPAKTGTGYVTIRTNIADPVPAGTRITPATAVNLAKIASPNGFTAMGTEPYAHGYILQLLEFRANVGGYGDVITLGDGSNAQNSLAMVPTDLVVDRVYIHGDPVSGQKRGIGLNSASTTIRDSYISEIWAPGQDSQAICGWNGPGPYLITNNYLEAAAENILMGGSDPAIPNLIPSDITFTRNHVTKPLAWRSRTGMSVKNLFELKNAQRVKIEGNVFEHNWVDAQVGYSILFTVRNQDGGAPWSVVQDVQFTNNILRNVASGINILGTDYSHPSGMSGRFVIRNNLFDNLSGATFGGDGRFMLINGGVDITVDHNTILQDGWSVLFADSNPVQQFTMTSNIAPDYAWAIMGSGTGPGNGTIAAYFPNATFLRGVFAGSNPSTYPTGNYYPANLDAVGFVNLANHDYHLAPASPYRAAALDGTDVGANIDAILAATAGVK